MRLKDKVILITGSTTGVGAAMARRFVDEGARVLVHGLECEAGAELVASLPGSALHIDDLSDAAAPARVVAAAIAAFGRLDAVVNNAAWVVRSDIGTTSAQLFDRCM